MYGELSFGEAGVGETIVLSAVEKDFNCFHSDGEVDLSVCRKVGFKNAQAKKSWHGAFSWNSEERGICWCPGYPDPACPSCGGATATCPAGCLFEAYYPMPDTTKYLDWSITAHNEAVVGGVTTAFATLHRAVHVNRFTGCQTVTGCSDNYSDIGTFTALQNALTGASTVDPCSLGHATHLPPNGAFDLTTMIQFFRFIASLFDASHCSGIDTCVISGCEPHYTASTTDNMTSTVVASLEVDATASPAFGHFQTFDTDGNPICDLLIQVSATTSHFFVETFGAPGSGDTSTSDIVNTLGPTTYTSDQLYADILTLLDRIDISDDVRYPWRVDAFISIAPLETFDEAPPTAPSISDAVGTMCPIPAVRCPFSGGLVGDLLSAGYGPFFDWSHKTWRSCQAPAFSPYIYAWGAWAKTPPPSPVPPYTFTTCPPAVCPGGQIPVISFRTFGGTLFFSTSVVIPGWTGSEPVAICGTNEIDGLYNISGPTGTGLYEYSVIAPQINDAPFMTGCEGGVVGVVNINTDATFYTVGDTTDLAMPATATQWTENYGTPLPAGSMPYGAWLILSNDILYAQKWAEIKVHRPSYNFARPCGIDKWMLDETKVTCVESSDGATPPTLTIYADIGLATNDLVYVCGVTVAPSVPDGVYKITKLTGTTYTLTTDTTMRRVLSATQSGPNVDIVMTDGMATISSGDSVDFVGVPGLGAGLIVTVTDATHFSVPGTLSGLYGAGGYAFVSGSGAFQIAPIAIDFNCSPGPDTDGIIGKIRFTDVPGICGRLGVSTAVQDGSKVKITTSDTHYLAQGESVDFTGVGGLGSSLTVIVLNSTQFEVTGTLSGPYVSGGFVSVTGAANYKWDDDQSKGNFLYATFDFNFRDFAQADLQCEQFHGGSYSVCGEDQAGCGGCNSLPVPCVEVAPGVWESTLRQTQAANGIPRYITGFTIDELCLPFDNCNPQILAIVPSGGPEVFTQPSHVEDFPAPFVSDSRYTSQWQAFYMQSYVDLLWQVPHKKCIVCDCDGCPQPIIPSGCSQASDDGSCELDTCVEECTTHTGTTFYAHPPEVEALQNIPAGAPTPPVGHIGYPTYSALSSGPVDPTWPRLLPPLGPGYGTSPGAGGVDPTLPAQIETPWTLAIKEWLCICADGRFKQEYLDNGQSIFCPP